MGGIFGRLAFDLHHDFAPGTLTRMADALAHRGPDSTGVYVGTGIALGERVFRDERSGLGDVAANESLTVRAVADSELANAGELRHQLGRLGHRFRVNDDAEVMAHAFEQWGESCVERFSGPFACAIWNAQDRRLLLARDRIGIRPLFFALLHGRALIFASEISGVLADQSVGREWNPPAVDAYLALGYVPAPLTIYLHISKLEPAHLLLADGRRLRMRPYWDLRFTPITKRATSDTVSMLGEQLQAATRDLAPGAHDVGVLQSGGTASLTLAAAARQVAPVRALVIGTEQETSDLIRAAEAARYVGCSVDVDVAIPDVGRLAPMLARRFDEPQADPVALSQYAVLLAARGYMDIALTGHGAATMWAGYAPYRGLASSLRACLGWPLACPATRAYGLFDDQSRRTMYTRGFAWQVRDAQPLARHLELYAHCLSLDPLARAIYVESRTFLPDNTLAIADRASLAASVRLRYPYLTDRLVELAASVPSALKQHGRGMHRLLRRSLPSSLMPPRARRPARVWLDSALTTMVPTVLLHERFDGRGIFSKPVIARLWDEHRSGRANHTHRFWSLLMLEFWFREFIDGDAAEEPLEYAVIKAA